MKKFWPVICFVLAACAQVVTPSGGPVDVQPPRAVNYYPDSAAVNTKPKKIQIDFDEYVQLKDVNKQVIVSPVQKEPADISASGRRVTIEFEDTLLDNTTYTIDFGSALADIREATAAKGFRYVFSTGPAIDTTRLAGNIRNAFTGKPEPDLTVMLYKNLADSAPYKSKPFYYTRTGADGNFAFTNLKKDRYRLFALRDGNANFKPEPDEAIAFHENEIELKTDTNFILSAFVEVPSRLFVKSATLPSAGRIDLAFSKPADSLEIDLPLKAKSVQDLFLEYSSQKDTLTLFYSKAESDSVVLVLRAPRFNDTLEKKLPVESLFKGKKPFTVESSNLDQRGFLNGDTLSLKMSLPVVRVDTSRLYYKSKSLSKALRPAMIIQKDRRTIRIPVFAKKDSIQTIRLEPFALTSLTGKVNDTLEYTIRRKPGTATGRLKFEFSAEPANYVVEILNEAGLSFGKVMTGMDGKGNLVLDLDAGAYVARAIKDLNKNNKWDPGHYLSKTQAEPVYLFEKKLTVRSGWDLEEKWELK